MRFILEKRFIYKPIWGLYYKPHLRNSPLLSGRVGERESEKRAGNFVQIFESCWHSCLSSSGEWERGGEGIFSLQKHLNPLSLSPSLSSFYKHSALCDLRDSRLHDRDLHDRRSRACFILLTIAFSEMEIRHPWAGHETYEKTLGLSLWSSLVLRHPVSQEPWMDSFCLFWW